MNLYSSLLTEKRFLVSDHKAVYQYITERHLHAIWYEQKFFGQLTTSKGEPITVISPGIWNFGGGPDFCRARLKIGNEELVGDIEIHFSDDSWYHHSHHQDSNYDDVILHVSLWHSLQGKPLVTNEGREINRTYLEPSLTIPPEKIPQLIDLDLYPYQQFLGSGKCAQTLFHTLSDEKIQKFFQSASEWRLVQKMRYLSSRIENPALQLGGGVAMALGYKNNTESFLDLFLFLIPFRDLPESELLAFAMGICGFFEDKYEQLWGNSSYYQELKFSWGGLAHEALHQTQMRFDKIRPLNHPVRRLVYLTKLLNSNHLETLSSRLFSLWNHSWKNCYAEHQWKDLHSQLIAAIPSFPDSYWNIHYLFEDKIYRSLSLIGEDLKTSILINTYFPLLYNAITARGIAYEREAFLDFYASLKGAKSSKSKYLAHRFFGDTPKNKLLNNAWMEQGAYQLHKDFCLHYEASCSGCPFVDRFKQTCKG